MRNCHSDCTVGKNLIVAKNSDKCVGGAKWKPFSLPVNATPVLVGGWVSISSLVKGSLVLALALAPTPTKMDTVALDEPSD